MGVGRNAPADDVQDWSQEVHYQKLIRIPEVRRLVDRHAAMAKKRLSGEDVLAFFDKVVPIGVSMEKLGAASQPLWARLGAKTAKQRTEVIPGPPGTVIVAVLCSLARQGQVVQQVRQSDQGCCIDAELPSDMWSFAGRLSVDVRRDGAQTCVTATTDIQGQVFDWGKSKRGLDALFEDIKATSV